MSASARCLSVRRILEKERAHYDRWVKVWANSPQSARRSYSTQTSSIRDSNVDHSTPNMEFAHIADRKYDSHSTRHSSTQKVTLSDFKYPIASFFIFSSFVYSLYHWVWWTLETDEIERSLSEEIKTLETRLESLQTEIDSQSQTVSPTTSGKRSWIPELRFWSRKD